MVRGWTWMLQGECTSSSGYVKCTKTHIHIIRWKETIVLAWRVHNPIRLSFLFFFFLLVSKAHFVWRLCSCKTYTILYRRNSASELPYLRANYVPPDLLLTLLSLLHSLTSTHHRHIFCVSDVLANTWAQTQYERTFIVRRTERNREKETGLGGLLGRGWAAVDIYTLAVAQ